MLGVGLYIGEGTKTQGLVRVINSDPKVIQLAIKWFMDVFGLPNTHFHLDIHLYPDNDIEKSLTFWSVATGIPRLQFGKTQIDRRQKTTNKRGVLQYGTAHLRIKSCGKKEYGVFLFRRIIFQIETIYQQLK